MIDHVALLVRDAEKTAGMLRRKGLFTGQPDRFESEGTLEIYCGAPGSSARLLLMQSIGPGPYARALEKRGPGLHHIAVNVPSIPKFLERISGSGWLLHPASCAMMGKGGAAYLTRPGMPMLIEVQEGPGKKAPAFVSSVVLKMPERGLSLAAAAGIGGLLKRAEKKESLRAGGKVFDLRALAESAAG